MATIKTERTRAADGQCPSACHADAEERQRCIGQIVQESLPLDEKDILVKVLEIIDDRKGAGDVDIAALT